MHTLVVVIVSLLLFALLIWSLTVTCPVNQTETWINYQELPFGNIRGGATIHNIEGIKPLGFYKYPVYRRPLNWPACHLVDYPIPHCRSDSL